MTPANSFYSYSWFLEHCDKDPLTQLISIIEKPGFIQLKLESIATVALEKSALFHNIIMILLYYVIVHILLVCACYIAFKL